MVKGLPLPHRTVAYTLHYYCYRVCQFIALYIMWTRMFSRARKTERTRTHNYISNTHKQTHILAIHSTTNALHISSSHHLLGMESVHISTGADPTVLKTRQKK